MKTQFLVRWLLVSTLLLVLGAVSFSQEPPAELPPGAPMAGPIVPPSAAAPVAVPEINSGDTAWMLVS